MVILKTNLRQSVNAQITCRGSVSATTMINFNSINVSVWGHDSAVVSAIILRLRVQTQVGCIRKGIGRKTNASFFPHCGEQPKNKIVKLDEF